MGHSVTLGGNRLGSGNKQKVHLHGFERSTHDLGYVFRNTQSPGTLVPFLSMLALPGDTLDINLGADVKTHPTVGPLFASYKLQLDVFECPIRLYHAWLHNNKLKIGLDMSKVKLPQIEVIPNEIWYGEKGLLLPLDQQQINPSCLLAYLGLRGWGNNNSDNPQPVYKNALPLLAMMDIYKQYYSNKQEEIGYYIHSNQQLKNVYSVKIKLDAIQEYDGVPYNIRLDVTSGTEITFEFDYILESNGDTPPVVGNSHTIVIDKNNNVKEKLFLSTAEFTSVTAFDDGGFGGFHCISTLTNENTITIYGVGGIPAVDETLSQQIQNIKLKEFNLEDIDDMREAILAHNGTTPFIINNDSPSVYGEMFNSLQSIYSRGEMSTVCSQEGLLIKTYQSDIFNNWLNTEWIDGAGGINEITAIDTSEGKFDLNTLALAQKVYDMLNRIAVSGGTYEDWLNAVYDHDSFRRCESPMYYGGLSKEIIFNEVVSTTATADEPLATLAGKGGMSKKHKGGQVTIKVNEPSYIIGIVSITPRIDYSQGNEFFMEHKTMNDIHKPSLDEIGFQDLVTDKMAWWDTKIDSVTGLPIYKSAGKQPAWLDYMTNYNKLYGNFAIEDNEMFMTLARKYEHEIDGETPYSGKIKDLTSYIDPVKYNYAFAQTSLDAMNFWVQIGVDITARRKMSAKLMPNL